MRKLALLCVACAACATGPKPAPDAEPDIAPRPFTAEQIRDAMPVGSELFLKMDAADKPTVIEHWRVVAADANGCTIAAELQDEAGKVLEDQGQETNAWSELMKHATFPAAETTRTEVTVEVPAGRFESIDYVVRHHGDDGDTTTTYDFAKQLPGPPVLLEVQLNGKFVRRMSLVSRK